MVEYRRPTRRHTSRILFGRYGFVVGVRRENLVEETPGATLGECEDPEAGGTGNQGGP